MTIAATNNILLIAIYVAFALLVLVMIYVVVDIFRTAHQNDVRIEKDRTETLFDLYAVKFAQRKRITELEAASAEKDQRIAKLVGVRDLMIKHKARLIHEIDELDELVIGKLQDDLMQANETIADLKSECNTLRVTNVALNDDLCLYVDYSKDEQQELFATRDELAKTRAANNNLYKRLRKMSRTLKDAKQTIKDIAQHPF